MAEKNTKWHQVLAALGVMLSLGFVGYEIRQNTRVARAAAVQGISETVIEWTTAMLENDDWMRIETFVDNGGKPEDLSPLDQRRYPRPKRPSDAVVGGGRLLVLEMRRRAQTRPLRLIW